jgi:hypothetical protein
LRPGLHGAWYDRAFIDQQRAIAQWRAQLNTKQTGSRPEARS